MSFNINNFTTSHERAKFISFMASLFALIYHVGVLFIFLFINLKFMFFYNIFSVTLFTITTITVPKAKNYILHYTLTAVEVIAHQILSDYFLSSYSSFHFFILLIALLPLMIFEDKHVVATLLSWIAAVIFTVLELVKMPGTFTCPNIELIIQIFRGVNISLTVVTIVLVVVVFTYIALRTERELNKNNDKLKTEIALAATVQQSFFQQPLIDFDDWELKFYNKPFAGVSGDFFDVYHDDKKLNGFGLMDVSGHGISSGMITMLVRNIILKEFNQDMNIPLSETVDRINERVIADKGDINNYLTGVLVRIEGNKLEYVNAGHPYPLFYKKADDEVRVLKRSEEGYGPIGITELPVVFNSQFQEMESGDEFILYTDGITEAENKQKEQFGLNRLIDAVGAFSFLPAGEQINQILKHVSMFTEGKEADDDITIMILKKK